ncbi:VOC family protein [Paenibacillus sp. HJL G12]|uniref:VOC family protein n=1 Tax=Paenibacillus dendrobii TaxID=2691084 RepID=A0A7X3IG05_9BACL|nr:VOC family protein [Paenibacillus dendrobii]MWV43150.1 VOC family protein [Paenibacillus dendrobii]
MNSSITPFLMFEGHAEEAMNFYVSIFTSSEIHSITRYGENEAGAEGSVQKADFSLKGQSFMCIDSNVKHAFSFTPAISMFVTCDSEEEITEAFHKLSEEGAVLMPLSTYPFAKKFGWVQDKFGVSWQLSY